MRIALLFLAAVVAGCSPPPAPGGLFPEVALKPEYARGFEIRKEGGQYQVVLYHPAAPDRPLQVLRPAVPARRIACLSTTQLAMADAIGEWPRVRAVGYAHLISDSTLRAHIREAGTVNLTTGDDIDPEVLLSVHPDLLLTYPFQASSTERYEEWGITCLPFSEYLEPHPLGRAEWIRLMGFLLGCPERADSVFFALRDRYQSIRRPHAPDDRPVVFFGSYEAGTWYAPPGNSLIRHLVEDAGGQYIFADSLSEGNIRMDGEWARLLAPECTWWGELLAAPGTVTAGALAERHPALADTRPFAGGGLFYCNTATSDYFGKALLEPDVLLADLVGLFHPGADSLHRPSYFFPARP